MTAVEPLALIAQLEQALASVSSSPWSVDANHDERAIRSAEGPAAVTNRPEDAAAIVAAVNLAPKLATVVRAVWNLADELERSASAVREGARTEVDDAICDVYDEAAARLRAVVAQHLGGETDA